MMEPVNILDARNNLSRLVSAAEHGEEVVIAKRGKPVARLTAIEGEAATHTGGSITAWLRDQRLPDRLRRSTSELDRQITAERQGWE